tara:strand:- start:596 stop:1096 length:501 start_codon:yes stop_codon:yes gene_type:complete
MKIKFKFSDRGLSFGAVHLVVHYTISISMELIKNEKVSQIINEYPREVSFKLQELRSLIVETAKETGVDKLVEATKWGEPSYLTKKGSTIRMDWKQKTPDKYYLYFICTTELVSTFRILFGDELAFEGNRAIILELREPLPVKALQECISLALTYHKIKHLPMLGI